MLFRPSTLKGIAEGTVTRAYRRWDRPRVRPGGRQRTPAGVVAFDSVEPVARESLTDADALAAGLTGLDELLELVDRRPAGEIYRVDLHLAGPDPRVALRESTPGDAEVADLSRRLGRLDRASRHGPWTAAVLRAIADQPGVRAADLAASFGRDARSVQARCPQAEGTRADREPAAGLSAVATRSGRAGLTRTSVRPGDERSRHRRLIRGTGVVDTPTTGGVPCAKPLLALSA